MDLLNIRSHFHDGARQAAGTFLSPLTNAIGEQRRLVESMAMVSRVRVEECKHMMAWGKCQTDDLGDVLLKLNLLIRKISDYEICFGAQYEDFREKIKFLRTKDDTLCEMGRRQNDLQSKIYEASKSRLRSAKAILLQKELEAVQKEDEPTETELHHLKRHLIKDAYMGQLDAIIELGRKMQIIGEHGKQLLEHIHVVGGPESADDGEATEDILQEARVALENWNQYTIPVPQTIVVHPPPAVSVSGASAESSKTIAVSTGPIEKEMPDAPPLPPRSNSRCSSKSGHYDDDEKLISKEEALRRQEEIELEKAMELSLASATPVVEKFPDLRDLNLTEEELRFVMDGDVVPQQLTKKLTIKLPLSAAGSTKIPDVPKVPRAPQMYIPEPEVEDAKGKTKDQEELENRSKDEPAVIESMEDTTNKSALPRNTTVTRSKTRPLESMGAELETPLESMGAGADTEITLESMGQDGHQEQDNQAVPFVPMPEVPPLEGVRHQKIITNLKKKHQEQLMQLLQLDPSTPFPVSPELQYLQVAATPYPNSPELQYLQVANSPQVQPATASFTPSTLSMAPTVNMMSGGGGHSSSASGTYQVYKPSTTYVPQATKQRNRQSVTPPPRDGLTSAPLAQQQPLSQNSTSNRYLLQQQRLKFLQEQKQQQQMYQAFYLSPYEQDGSLSSSDLTSKSEHEHAESLGVRERGKEGRYSMPPLSDNYAF